LLQAFSHCLAQEVRIQLDQIPLNEVFLQLKDKYGVQFSFNDAVISSCDVTANKKFSSVEKVISFLVKECGFEYQKEGDVYIVRAPKKIR
jgi:acyl carrier protein